MTRRINTTRTWKTKRTTPASRTKPPRQKPRQSPKRADPAPQPRGNAVIISWFTEPPSSFASYYQHDTVTQRFSRIRLQLGRQSLSATNDTFVSYKPHRAVGFSAQRYSTSDPGSHWSVNEKGALCYDNAPLPSSKPNDGDRVYDSSDPSSFVHRGNAVTNSPELPAGIEPKHLALLA